MKEQPSIKNKIHSNNILISSNVFNYIFSTLNLLKFKFKKIH